MIIKYCIISVIITFFCLQAKAGHVDPYRPAHKEACYEIKGHKIPCGNFRIESTILSKKYKYVQTGKDVMASFSVSTHPGDHPFLKQLATRLDYVDAAQDSLTNQPISIWPSLGDDKKNILLDRYSAVVSTAESTKNMFSYINICLGYWSHPEADHEIVMQLPTLAEVAALCIAESGVLDSRAP